MSETLASSMDYWVHRKQFTKQLASITFMTYLMSVGHRHPHKIYISKQSGNIWGSEFVPGLSLLLIAITNLMHLVISSNSCLYTNQEAVPFRFTPNLQRYIGVTGIEGPFSSALMSLGMALSEPEVCSLIFLCESNTL